MRDRYGRCCCCCFCLRIHKGAICNQSHHARTVCMSPFVPLPCVTTWQANFFLDWDRDICKSRLEALWWRLTELKNVRAERTLSINQTEPTMVLHFQRTLTELVSQGTTLTPTGFFFSFFWTMPFADRLGRCLLVLQGLRDRAITGLSMDSVDPRNLKPQGFRRFSNYNQKRHIFT